jgi:hypothetical protein
MLSLIKYFIICNLTKNVLPLLYWVEKFKTYNILVLYFTEFSAKITLNFRGD